jgi:hypothetical protein
MHYNTDFSLFAQNKAHIMHKEIYPREQHDRNPLI